MQAITYLFFMSGLDRLPKVAKNIKISTDQFFAPKISTKNARFTTFLNLRQNSVNVFKIKYFYATGSTGTCVNSTGATSTGATSTVGLVLPPVFVAPVLLATNTDVGG